MNAPCHDFRRLLEASLIGRAASDRLVELSWHEHLFACAECRRLLEAEEALESLLASLPEPRLAPAVRERVLVRLRAERALDALLELDVPAQPADLTRSVLARVAAERGATADAQLDRLLALDVVAAPAGLAQRTVARLRRARRPQVVASRWSFASSRSRWFAAAAAAAVLAFVAWAAWPDRGAPRDDAQTPPVVEVPRDPQRDLPPAVGPQATGAPDAEMLAALDVLENWDVLMSEDVDLLLSSLPASYAAVVEDLEEGG